MTPLRGPPSSSPRRAGDFQSLLRNSKRLSCWSSEDVLEYALSCLIIWRKRLMNNRERLLAILDRQHPDRIPWIPRLLLWYQARQLTPTMPKQWEGLSLR